jgi:hypothetical protein
VKFPPFEACQVDREAIETAFTDDSVERIFLTLRPPVLPAIGMNDFLSRNPDALILDIGRQSESGLKESWLSARTDNKEAISTWRRLAKKLRAMTRTGVTAVNPKTGATARLKDHRFSEGAKLLESEGFPMLPVAGSARLRFESK